MELTLTKEVLMFKETERVLLIAGSESVIWKIVTFLYENIKVRLVFLEHVKDFRYPA